MNGLHTRTQMRQARRAASFCTPNHRRIDTVIGWVGCIGLAVFVLIELSGSIA